MHTQGLFSIALSLLLFHICHVCSNVEKTIFLGPPSVFIPDQHPNMNDLMLDLLSPKRSVLRTHLNASFPDKENEHGTISWFLLDGLTEGQRYEVRICWVATQPTDFQLRTHTLLPILANPALLKSLATYSDSRQPDLASPYGQSSSLMPSRSILFLEVHAAASYFSLNRTLMTDVPPVLVDIILDPFVANMFPRSLVPTAVYLGVLAMGAWVLSKMVAGWLLRVGREWEEEDGKGKKDL